MAKQLGQIHTANFEIAGLTTGHNHLLDCAGELSHNLQTMVRMGSYFKVVGIDMTLSNVAGSVVVEPIPVAGRLLYFAPTRGRCQALKDAFKAVREGMKLQGINVRGNKAYDFRPLMFPVSTLQNGAAIANIATIDGTNALTLTGNAASTGDSIFEVYNANLLPSDLGATPAFSPGFGLPGIAIGSATDYVLQEGEIFDPTQVRSAETQPEEIPFVVDWGIDTTTNTSAAVDWEWRPDPALYLAVLTGQFTLVLDQVPASGTNLELNAAIHISGWKSVMGSHGKKKRRHKRRR